MNRLPATTRSGARRTIATATATATALATLALAATSPAQRVPLTDGSGRQIVVLDVADLLPEARGLAAAPAPAPANGRAAAATPSSLERLAGFVRTFAAAGADTGADLQPLGDRHLVALGTAEQVAAAERLLVHARATLDLEFQVDLRLCTVPAKVFDEHVAPLLTRAAGAPDAGVTSSALVASDAANALRKKIVGADGANLTQFPQIVVPGLHAAKLRVGEEIAYVRDFEIEVVEQAFVANPIVDVLFHGHDVDVLCGPTGSGLLGVQVQIVDQVVERPIQTLATTVPGTTLPVTVQVPRVTGCRGSQTVELRAGATAVMAARKPGGEWLVSLLTVHTIPPAPAPAPAPKPR